MAPYHNFDLETSHVLPALLRKVHEAKVNSKESVPVWGTGRPRREFLHVEDLADACVFLLEQGVSKGLFNIGIGSDVTIQELAELIKKVVGYAGDFTFDDKMPDGTMRKLLDIGRIKGLGWQAKYSLEQGINHTYKWYLQQGS